MSAEQDFARRALALVDLTDLSEGCDAPAIDHLAQRALQLCVPVAALCIWPTFVGQAHVLLRESTISLATVVNFPKGGDTIEKVCAQTRRALSDGATEIDLVMPWRALLEGHPQIARDMIRAVADCLTPGALLKVILETGALGSPAAIRQASELAIDAGAHFLKTSTGKTEMSATPAAAQIMLEAIRASGRPVGFKASGGLRNIEQARLYLDLADGIMGADWACKKTFRFGASSLLDPLAEAVGDRA